MARGGSGKVAHRGIEANGHHAGGGDRRFGQGIVGLVHHLQNLGSGQRRFEGLLEDHNQGQLFALRGQVLNHPFAVRGCIGPAGGHFQEIHLAWTHHRDPADRCDGRRGHGRRRGGFLFLGQPIRIDGVVFEDHAVPILRGRKGGVSQGFGGQKQLNACHRAELPCGDFFRVDREHDVEVIAGGVFQNRDGLGVERGGWVPQHLQGVEILFGRERLARLQERHSFFVAQPQETERLVWGFGEKSRDRCARLKGSASLCEQGCERAWQGRRNHRKHLTLRQGLHRLLGLGRYLLVLLLAGQRQRGHRLRKLGFQRAGRRRDHHITHFEDRPLGQENVWRARDPSSQPNLQGFRQHGFLRKRGFLRSLFHPRQLGGLADDFRIPAEFLLATLGIVGQGGLGADDLPPGGRATQQGDPFVDHDEVFLATCLDHRARDPQPRFGDLTTGRERHGANLHRGDFLLGDGKERLVLLFRRVARDRVGQIERWLEGGPLARLHGLVVVFQRTLDGYARRVVRRGCGGDAGYKQETGQNQNRSMFHRNLYACGVPRTRRGWMRCGAYLPLSFTIVVGRAEIAGRAALSFSGG